MTFLKKILLVDHEPKVTKVIRCALEMTGNYLIRVERDRGSALHTTPWFVPDLVLLDAAGAESESEVVSRHVQREPALRDTPFLFVRADSGSGDKIVTGGFISGYAFLANPVPLQDLVRCVDEMLSQPLAATGSASELAAR